MSSPRPDSQWNIAREDRARTAEWAKALDVPRIIAHVLTLRGVDNLDAARRFLEPSLHHLADPFGLQDMQAAVDRITLARDRGEHVLVFGDYDVDGIAGTAILLHALQDFGIARCSYGLPSRFIEGYGLSADRVEAAAGEGVNLIVTVDNGINAREAADAAKRLGIDMVITDHHQLEGELPEAVAVVDPARDDPAGPCAHASGAAVAFKLAWALTGEQRDLDIVALGTVADIVPLVGENRDLVAAGLAAMQRSARPGVAALASVAHIEIEKVTAENIAFQLAPRINAAGRLQEAEIALHLLLADSPAESRRLALTLDRANEERREIEHDMVERAFEQLEGTFQPGQCSIVLADRDWHPGVIGIAAAQIATRYNRPVVLISINGDGIGRGSARSQPEFGMVEALAACSDLLEQFGGHLAAAGMTVREENIPAFAAAFEAEAARRLVDVEAPRTLDVDAIVSLSEVDMQLVRVLERLQPFGHGNPAPVLCSHGVQPVTSSVRELRGGHLKFAVREESRVVDVIGFRMGGRLTPSQAMDPVDIAYTPQLNTWRDQTSLQLVLKDLHVPL